MSLRSRLLRNTTYLTVGDKIGYLMQFVFFLYFAKKYGVIPVGEYSFAFFFTYAFALLSDLGATVYLLREVARNRLSDRQLFVDCLVLRTTALMILCIIAATVLVLSPYVIPLPKLKVLLCWGVYWIFFYIADVFIAELNAHEKMGRVALLGIWLKFVSTAAGVSLIYAGLNYDAVLIVFPISSFAYLCSCILVSIHTLGPIPIKFQKISTYRTLLHELTPFFFSVILVEILACQDILLLGFIRDDQSVGLYSSAIKIVTFILGVSTFINIAIFPILSRLFMESQERLIEVANKILRYLVLTSLPLSFGLAITSDKVISLLYPDSFQQAGIVLKITSWAIAAGFIQVVFSVLLTAINRQKEKVIFIGINFFLTTGLNVVCMYYYSYVGAAIIRVASTILGLVFFAYLVSKYLAPLPFLQLTLKPICACIVMTIFCYYFSQWNLIYLIPLSGLVYFTVLLALGNFSEEEMRYMKRWIPKALYSR